MMYFHRHYNIIHYAYISHYSYILIRINYCHTLSPLLQRNSCFVPTKSIFQCTWFTTVTKQKNSNSTSISTTTNTNLRIFSTTLCLFKQQFLRTDPIFFTKSPINSSIKIYKFTEIVFYSKIKSMVSSNSSKVHQI